MSLRTKIVTLAATGALTVSALVGIAGTADAAPRRPHPVCCPDQSSAEVVRPCKPRLTRGNHVDFFPGRFVYTPGFDAHFGPLDGYVGRAFVYLGSTPGGWVEVDETGGTLIVDWHPGMKAGRQPVVFFDSRGRVIAWDTVTVSIPW